MADISQKQQAGTLEPVIVGRHTCRAGWLTELKARNRRGTLRAVLLVLSMLAVILVYCSRRSWTHLVFVGGEGQNFRI